MITGPEAIELLEQAVAERGEGFIYSDRFGPLDSVVSTVCEYATYPRDGSIPEPACIVGLALFKFGISLIDLESMVGNVRDLLDYGVEMDSDAISAFQAAQSRQDGGQTWGDALEAARSALGMEVSV